MSAIRISLLFIEDVRGTRGPARLGFSIRRWTMRADGLPGPKCPTITPDSGSAITEPAAIANDARPSSDGSSWSRSRTWGIRDAQLANAMPEAMKTA